jgi:hypothetical protein
MTIIVTTVLLEQERYASVVRENTAPPFLLLDINSNAERANIPVTYSLTTAIAATYKYIHVHQLCR